MNKQTRDFLIKFLCELEYQLSQHFLKGYDVGVSI